MPTEEEIRKLADSLWDKDGRLAGKSSDYYLRAKKIQRSAQGKVIYLTG